MTNTITETIPFNFDDIYENIEQKFKDKGYDTQEGSNAMQLTTSMAYLVSMLNANTASNVNETILTLARKRSVALQDARVLGYEVDHIQSYQYTLTLSFSKAGEYRINKYDEFKSGDYTYYYFGETTDAFTVLEGETIEKTITVKEGKFKRYNSDENLTTVIESIYDSEEETWSAATYVDLPYTQVEDNGIEMFLTYYDNDGNFFELEEWTRSKQFMIESDTTLSQEFVRLDIIDYGTPRLYFKLGNIGKDLRVGTIININALISSGTAGVMESLPTTTLECDVIDFTLSVQGTDEESLSNIQQNAPLFNNTANRVVTINDYIAFCNRQTSVKYSSIWDGQSEYPSRSGNIWFSFIPSTVSRILSDQDDVGYTWELQDVHNSENWFIESDEIQDVYDVLDEYKIPTIKFKHRNPVYFDFDFEVNIPRYKIKTSEADINKSVFDVINSYFLTGDSESEYPAETFDFEYFQSNLIKRIDDELTDVMGFNLYSLNSIILDDNLLIEEEFTGETVYKKMVIHLGVPFEGVIDDSSSVIFDNIPKIETENLINNRTIYLDDSFTVSDDIYSINVLLTDPNSEKQDTDEIVGEYRIIDKTNNDIELTLYIKSDAGFSTGFDLSDLENEEIVMNVKYKTPNIPFNTNTMPRLKSVKFT